MTMNCKNFVAIGDKRIFVVFKFIAARHWYEFLECFTHPAKRWRCVL